MYCRLQKEFDKQNPLTTIVNNFKAGRRYFYILDLLLYLVNEPTWELLGISSANSCDKSCGTVWVSMLCGTSSDLASKNIFKQIIMQSYNEKLITLLKSLAFVKNNFGLGSVMKTGLLRSFQKCWNSWLMSR